MTGPSREVTALLADLEGGDQKAADDLLPLVYDELRSLADHYLRGERQDHTLQATALVHEAYMRLVGASNQAAWENRGHFYRVAARAMRRILVDHARKHRSAKRGGDRVRLSLTDAGPLGDTPDLDLMALDEALSRLAAFDPRKSRIIELRFFGGLTSEETAKALTVPLRTVERDWSLARAWLYRELTEQS